MVFCNTLGALPFTLADSLAGKWLTRESDATHNNVARRLRIKCVTRVWRVLQVPPKQPKRVKGSGTAPSAKKP